VDLNQLVSALVQSVGEFASMEMYMHAAPGQYPNLPPEGKQDNTHMQVAGAQKVADVFVADVKRQGLPLARWLK
jgi:hypothetical protein